MCRTRRLVLSVDQSEDLVVHVVLAGTRGDELEHVREQKRVAITDLELTGNKDEHRRTVHADLHVLGKHGHVVSHLSQAL